MILTRNQILKIGEYIKNIKNQNKNCGITVKYKLLKIEQFLTKEIEDSNYLLNEIIYKYAQKDDEGNILQDPNNEGIILNPETIKEAQKDLQEFYDLTANCPDFFFTFDELEQLELSWQELEAFMPFIK